MAQKTSSLWRTLQGYQIYGANTDVGKTIMSTIICRAFKNKDPMESVHYLKPVSTGPLSEADDRHISRYAPGTKTRCLFQFDEAVSPHIAARSNPLEDSTILSRVQSHMADCAASGPGVVLLETAGGVHSPTPSGSSQADLYRPLRLPVLLVADYRLGGISATISAFESLHIRGYDVDAVLQFMDIDAGVQYRNYAYLGDYFQQRGITSFKTMNPPERGRNEKEDAEMMEWYYGGVNEQGKVEELVGGLAEKHRARIDNLEEMAGRAHKQIWYPFTQHKDLTKKSILTIDSASGDFFQTRNQVSEGGEESGLLSPTFDGSASWWTQGLGHGNPELSLAAAYAAGRYGHVMFAGAVHEPAISLATTLLQNLRNSRLGKVFYSDNGSTGMEVATKMALTASFDRYKWNVPKSDVGVLGLKGSYHGDTIGAMDASEPSTFNEKVHWYKGRGHWFDFPRVKMMNGGWVVESPSGVNDFSWEKTTFETLGAIFDLQTRYHSQMGQKYREYIKKTLERLVKVEGKTFGALIMEPVILGAGGMLFADPLFQHCLVDVVRSSSDIFGSATPPDDPQAWTGLPVVFDEVFTGLYRLGRFSSSSFLQVHPDISCHAKLLTGGLVPLCTTLASDSIYNAFLSSEKRDALLHGHSYTAHAVGCHVANASLKIMLDMDQDGKWNVYKDDWRRQSVPGSGKSGGVEVWSVWPTDFVKNVSLRKDVESVIALGSVLAISLHDKEQAGYNSSAASGLQKILLEGSEEFKIHSRVLGNVFYLMAGQTSKEETLRSIEILLLKAIQ